MTIKLLLGGEFIRLRATFDTRHDIDSRSIFLEEVERHMDERCAPDNDYCIVTFGVYHHADCLKTWYIGIRIFVQREFDKDVIGKFAYKKINPNWYGKVVVI